MLKAINTTKDTVLANGIIPINLKRNTFPYISFSNNTITIKRAGNYNIKAVINFTATDSTTNIGLYNNGVLIPETDNTITTTIGDNYQLVIDDLETVITTLPNTQLVNLTLQTTTGLTSLVTNVGLVELR